MEERERKRAETTDRDGARSEAAVGSSSPSVAELGPGAEGEAGDDDPAKTDVCSERFDPLLALYSPNVTLPFPNIRSFNNVAEYESFLKGGRGRAKPENVEKKRRKANKGVADPERIERLKKMMINNPVPEEGDNSAPRRRRGPKPQKSVLTRMAACHGGPLGELYRCVEEKIRVKVHIRTFKGLRGVCSGFIVAFDKFWNMAMVDVDETYRDPLLGEALYHEKALTISRLFEKLKLQQSSPGKEPAAQHNTAEATKIPIPAGTKGESSAGPKLSDTLETRRQEHGAPSKAEDPTACKKKAYGKVHSRHMNQLFIRGENVILVNLESL
ncbi:U7 snRNA-associated Sm-like protein LSm11 [Thalassophryne amazonica]|uniref:U7 snRNA-associated Sm-like protein LSm11 n=1 Tax=Thalassophryne amazonica TaxID=390379 RepID=UPI001471FDBF|nr:U7 snRNA-associated Sm-like protein LSm11 [Thalassophryne amazonica]